MRRFLPIAFVVENDKTLREGALRDLTTRGARLSARKLPADEVVVAMRFRSPRSGPIVAARVIRRDGADAWIEILSVRPAVLQFWAGLVASQG